MKETSKILLALLFSLAGINHFWHSAIYVRIMPPYLPWPLLLVWLSGLCEIGLGLALLWPPLSAVAAWGLIALLIAVFPANIHMASHPELFPHVNPAVWWLRLPLQGVLIAWVYWHTRRPPDVSGGA